MLIGPAAVSARGMRGRMTPAARADASGEMEMENVGGPGEASASVIRAVPGCTSLSRT